MTNYPFEHIPLDNAGKIFPGQNSKRWSNVFRMAIELKEKVEPTVLKVALDKTLNRLPTFKVRMKNGVFQNYYEINTADCPVTHDVKNFCYRIGYKENNGYLFRVYYHKRRISIDFYHAVCDGYGACVFISTLVGEYLRLKGYSISYNQLVLNTSAGQNRGTAAHQRKPQSFSKPLHIIKQAHSYLNICATTPQPRCLLKSFTL